MLEWGHKSDGAVQVLRDDSAIARVRAAAMRERADVEIDGTQWSYFKQSGELLGEPDGAPQPTIRASRPSKLRQRWDVEADGSTYHIEPLGFLQTQYRVSRNGSEIGTSAKATFWSNRPTLEVDAVTPLEHQVFLLWVAFLMRRRAGAAAAGSGGG